MKPTQLLLATLVLMAANSDVAGAASQNLDTISYRCGDIVVIGSVQNVDDSYKHIEIEDDILGHGWMTAYIRIKRVLYGSEARSAVHAEYFGHTYLAFASGKSYLVVLRPANDGTYTAASIQRWNSNSKVALAEACT